MITTKEVFNNPDQPFPTWIKTHPVFNKINYIRKVFPDLGIPNFEEKIVVDNVKEISAFAYNLLDVISVHLDERNIKLIAFAKKAKIGKARREQLSLLTSVMSCLVKQLRLNKEAFIINTPTGKVNLGIPEDIIYNNAVFMKKGAGLLKLYEKFSSILKDNKFTPLQDLTQTYQFKNFSSINIPAKETVVKFTSDGKEGVWDIATMSMRGVNSCQTWDAGIGNSGKIIGSIIDPFTGIIYLTTNGSDHNHYGSKMVRRCVVRYAIDKTNKDAYLLLERMYPAFDKPSLDTFITALKKRAPNINIHYSTDIGEKATTAGTKLSYSYIPLSDELKMLDRGYYPYADSGITFAEDTGCKYSKNTESMKQAFKQKMPQLFQEALKSKAFKQADIKKFGKIPLQLISQLRGLKKTKLSEIIVKKSTKPVVLITDKMADQIGTQLADFICSKSDCDDPFKYMQTNKKDCATFLESVFDKKINLEFAEFMTNKIADYIKS